MLHKHGHVFPNNYAYKSNAEKKRTIRSVKNVSNYIARQIWEKLCSDKKEPTNACRLCKRQYSAHFCCGIFQLFVHNICNSEVSFTEQSKCTCFGRFKIMSTIYLISTGARYVTLKLNSKEDLLKLTACSYQTKLEVIESLYVYPSKIAFERTKLRSDTEGGRVVTNLSFSKFNYDIFYHVLLLRIPEIF